ncbi:hypothetical protein [Streptomyces sp. NPDC091215]|uniref:hypothetical protein n=1 Tax=Streptomyces sp. NPDC091215 TaxID=3155192 RepID=UPI0034139358
MTPETPNETAQRIADALTAAAFECDGKCGLSEQECYDAHPIMFSAMSNGTTHVNASVTAIAELVLSVLPDPAAARAAGLREAAAFVDNDDDCGCGGCDSCIPRKFAADLRRMADHVQSGAQS